MERDLSFVGYVDVKTNESEIQHTPNFEDQGALDSSNETEDLNLFQISLSSKVTKRNGTIYLAVFSVPMINPKSPQGRNSVKYNIRFIS